VFLVDNRFIIIDTEIGNNMLNGSSKWEKWDNSKGQVICLGVAICNKEEILEIKQLFKRKENEKTFAKECISLMKEISLIGDMYAFNNVFDIDYLFNLTNVKFDIKNIEIKNNPFHKKSFWFKKLLLKNPLVKDVYDPFQNNSFKCVENYQRYLETDDTKLIKDIFLHNKSCLIKEWAILCNKELLESNSFVNFFERYKEEVYLDFLNLKEQRKKYLDEYISKTNFVDNKTQNLLKKLYFKNCSILRINQTFKDELIPFDNSLSFLFKIYIRFGIIFLAIDMDHLKILIRKYVKGFFSN
jgi:hypothetical protein